MCFQLYSTKWCLLINSPDPLIPEFYFQHEMWIVLLLRTSGECNKTNFHSTDCLETVGTNGLTHLQIVLHSDSVRAVLSDIF